LETYGSVEDLRNYTLVKINQINTTTSKNLLKVLEKYLDLMFDSVPTHIKFNRSVDSFVSSTCDMLYFDALLEHMATNLTKQDIELYVWWKVVENSIAFTTEEMRASHEIEQKTYKTRLNHCLDDVNNLMGMAVSPAIIYPEFLSQSKPKIEKIFENLRNAFTLLVHKVKWMDKRAKEETIKKVDNMKSLIGFPEWLFNKTRVNAYYKGVSDPSEKSKNAVLFFVSFQ
jgi:predicted metalloendopeptidase